MKQNSRISIVILMIIISFTACKEDNYIDWKVKNDAFLEQNKTKPGVVTTASGLQYKIIDDGWSYNRKPNKTSYVDLKYVLSLVDGSKLQSGEIHQYLNDSYSVLISGFIEGVTKIHDGGSIILYIPSDLGYGKDGSGTTIPSHSTLIYQIDLDSSQN